MEDANKGLKKRVNFLTVYAMVSSIALAFLVFNSFKNQSNDLRLDELTLKKLNLVGEDGSLRMVISNETRQHSGIVNGKVLPERERPAGIIFFNNQGDECGGIIASVDKEKGGGINSGMSFTMDNYHDDQVVQILNDETYEDGKAQIQRGFIINEFPVGSDLMERYTKHLELEKIADQKEREAKISELWNKEGAKRRLFVGRNNENNSGLFLYDTEGNPKLKIYVDQNGEAKNGSDR